jgi:hypothetical protein
MNNDLDDVIESAVNDSLDSAPVDDTPTEVVEDTSSSEITPGSAVEDAPAEEATTDEVVAGGIQPSDATKAEQDDFAKKFGLQAQSVTGRENRIPYSRVKKIVEKAQSEAVAKATKDIEAKFTPQLTELGTKVTDYEGRLQRVAEFENILENDPKQFLTMLSKVPAYKEFFDFVSQAAAGPATEPEKVAQDPTGNMPQPDQTLADGSKVYSMEGLQSLLKWQADQVEQRTIQQVEQRYAPIEQAWKSQEHMAKIVPVVEKQIAEARTWPNFDELEPEIIQSLKADKNISLERAYMQAYQKTIVPKLAVDRNKIRTDLLAEIKKKPVASAAPAGNVRPGAQPDSGAPKDLADIIAAAVADSGIK